MAQKEIAMLFDSSRCTGCKGCQVACKQWNMLPSPMGLNENVFHGSYQNPPNLNGDTRLVMTFDEKPSGDACPFDVPRFRPTDGRIDKCTLCLDRLEEGEIPACVKTCQPEALKFGPREEMIALGKQRVEFLKAKGFEKAELYGEHEMGGLHILQVCKYGHEAYGLPTDPKPDTTLAAIQAMKPVTAVGTAAVVAGLAVSFLAAAGYRRKKVSIEEAKAGWTPEQRAKADREVAEALRRESAE